MHLRPFEIGLLGLFGFVAFGGLIFLATYKSPSEKEETLYGDSVIIWGTFDRGAVEGWLSDLAATNKALDAVRYEQIDARSFDSQLLNAIAEGRSPDLVMLPHSLLVTYRTKLQVIPAETLDPQVFRNTYVDGAEIYVLSDGTYGLPLAVDPLVMYWNRDIFSGSGLASPPSTWESLVTQVPSLVRKDLNFNITQSAVAFGEYGNVKNAKEVLSALLLQAGGEVVDESTRGYEVTLEKNEGTGLSPAEATLTFYTQFVVPGRELYSWNRSKPLDRSEFIAGKLALYFGKGSERDALELENANLNFDVAPMPQGEGSTVKRTYGEFYAFAIPRASKNIGGAYAAASYLASAANIGALVDALDLVPVHRSLHGVAASDPSKRIIRDAALVARGWLDPSPAESTAVFRRMIEEYTSGRARLNDVIDDAVSELTALFR